jgi:hypothetical protein
VVIDGWLHLEQTNERHWWMRLGGARIWINIEPDGNARVDVVARLLRGCPGCFEIGQHD